MQTFFKKSALFLISLTALIVFSVPCYAQSFKQNEEKSTVIQFNFTVPRAVAAGSAIVLFACSQIVIYKKTDRK